MSNPNKYLPKGMSHLLGEKFKIFSSALAEYPWIVLFGLTLLCMYPFAVTTLLNMAAVFYGSGGVDFNARSSLYYDLFIRIIVSFVYNLIFFTLFVISLSELKLKMVRSTGLIVLWFYLVVFTIGSVLHFCLYRQVIGVSSIYAILDTNIHEGLEFAQSVIRADLLFLSFLSGLPLFFGASRFLSHRSLEAGCNHVVSYASVTIVCLLGYVGLKKEFLQENNPVLFAIGSIGQSIAEKAAVRALSSSAPPNINVTLRDKNEGPITHILVIGESTTRRHMSLYGYGRDTTPRLSQLAMEKQIEIAQDACSSRGATLQQFKELLTFATREDHRALFTGPNLVQVMKSAGFHSYWISNQQLVGGLNTGSDNWPAVFAQAADVQTFINKRGFGAGRQQLAHSRLTLIY
ncbi:sulfatase-like hydrolase/transferase [Microvirga aerilata]|uniref:sulfatase-like hydrolase/transferase n=1 Tax=Microvirga aerilata TaxID=670292 RepID=UPI0036289B71